MAIDAQPEEIVDIAFNYSNYTVGGITLVSAIGFASRKLTATPTQLAAQVSTPAAVSAQTIVISANPGVGALMTIGPAAAQDVKKAKGVAALGAAFAVELHSPLAFPHSAVEDVNYFPGVTPTYLATSSGSVSTPFAKFRTQYGASGQTYTVSSVGLLSDGQKIEGQVDVVILEV